MTQAAKLAALGSAGVATGFKNRIINGGMTINQRNFSGSISSTGATFTLDRWTIYATQASKLTVSQNAGSVTPPTGYVNYLGVTSSSAYSVISTDVFHLSQYIEGYNTADLMFGTANAATFTLSFWVRSSLTGTFAGCFENVNNDRAYPFTYTISAANTWEQKTITVTGDTTGTWNTTNDRGLSVRWNLGAGTDYNGTAGVWQAGDKRSVAGTVSVVGTNGATFYITGIQLEVGTTATTFDFRDYGRELFLCQRYFFGFGNLGSNRNYLFPQPGNPPSSGGGMPLVFTPPATMRTAPDVTYNISSGNYTISTPSGTQWRMVAPAIDACTLSGSTVGIVGLSAVNAVGISLLYASINRQPSIIEFGSTAYLFFSAEL